MTTEEKAEFNAHFLTIYAGGGFGAAKCPPAEGTLPSETDTWSETNMWARPGDPNYSFDKPGLDASAATKGILEQNSHYFIIRDNPTANV